MNDKTTEFVNDKQGFKFVADLKKKVKISLYLVMPIGTIFFCVSALIKRPNDNSHAALIIFGTVYIFYIFNFIKRLNENLNRINRIVYKIKIIDEAIVVYTYGFLWRQEQEIVGLRKSFKLIVGYDDKQDVLFKVLVDRIDLDTNSVNLYIFKKFWPNYQQIQSLSSII